MSSTYNSTLPLSTRPTPSRPDLPLPDDPHARPPNPDGYADFGADTLNGDGLGV